jgi:DNA-binding GntR family transcriptional regulator
VVQWIVAAILAGRMVPAQKLIEADISAALGISRGPVREALKRLEAQGVVTLSRHRGAYVRAFTRAEMEDLLVILDALTAVMARAAAEAVALGADDAAMRRAQAQLEGWGASGHDGLIVQRRHFYDALIAIGGNGQLAAVMPLLRIHLLRLQVQPFFGSGDLADRTGEYAAITAAVLAGDAGRAERAMRHHMRRMTSRLRRLPDSAFALHPSSRSTSVALAIPPDSHIDRSP